MCLQGKEHQELLTASFLQKLEERRGAVSPSERPEESTRLTPWFWISGLQNWERIRFCCFKSLSFWSLVRAALGNEYSPYLSPSAQYLKGIIKWFFIFIKNIDKKRFYLFTSRERGREKERETSMCGCLLSSPYRGLGSQPRHVPWLGIKPVTFWFTGWHSIHWAAPDRAKSIKYYHCHFTIWREKYPCRYAKS